MPRRTLCLTRVATTRHVRLRRDFSRRSLPCDFNRRPHFTIKRYLKQGRLAAYHLGPRTVRINRRDLLALLAPGQEMKPMKPKQKPAPISRPSKEEIERRKAVAAEILALRAKTSSLAPLTTAELVRRAREDEMWYGKRPA